MSTSIQIRALTESDRDWVCGLLADPKVTRFLPFDPMTPDQGNERVDSYLKLNFPLGSFVSEIDGVRAGLIFIRPYTWEIEFQGLEIGYLIDPTFWGKGIASALANFVANHYRTAYQGSEKSLPLFALIDDQNIASQKVVTRAGFSKTAASKKYPGSSIWSLQTLVDSIQR